MNTILIIIGITATLSLIGWLASSLRANLRATQQEQQAALRQTVELVLQQLNRGQESHDRGSNLLHNRLDSATRVISEVEQKLTQLEAANQRMLRLGEDIASLQRILQAPKLRGNLGEIWLAELIAQIIPPDHYKLQYAFKNGEICDAVIFLREQAILPIDAKFSLENFVKMLEQPEAERAGYRKLFVADTKKRIDEIARKYVQPDQGTLAFAFMYVPAENVYYQAFIQDEPDLQLSAYAFSKRVIPISPSSFYAYLQIVLFGLRGMEIERSAHHIQRALGGLGVQLGQAREQYDKLGTHLRHASQSFDLTDRKLAGIEQQVERLAERPTPATLTDSTPHADPPVSR